MSAITIDGDLVHYEKLGRGRPVILLHGWLGSWRYWIPTMQQLHLKYSVYTLDFIGYGDSAKNSDKYTLDKQARLLNAFMDQLGIPKAAMIGHGFGGMVLARFASAFPDKVARMLLISLPLFDPGDLKDRTPAGHRVLLTPPTRDRYSLSPNMAQVEAEYRDKTLARSPLANLQTAQPTAPSATEPAKDTPTKPSAPVKSGDTPPPSTPEVKSTSEPTLETRPPVDVNQTQPMRSRMSDGRLPDEMPRTGIPYGASSRSNEMPTMATVSPEDRKRLVEAASRSPIFSVSVSNDTNQLLESFTGKTLMSLLEKCFKKSDVFFEKLRPDVEKTDDKTLIIGAQGYSAGKFLDELRKITAPMVVIHGLEDGVITAPTEEVWQYLTIDKDDVFVPIPLPNVRHFPMLEHEPFMRLALDFLETPEISKLEVRERWRRRSR